ncbi:1-acyl-sn-glycerol-3-phosphate acyltransferase [Vibrio alginolyticus]|uniref:1-acyl-sn-glycerol-3-phosphate acyltransferase n=1 Tax=Vibrio alginolyticus TaxID=663 RepID=UPI001BD308AD|nr:1-acyl-sn-glycerol-3-phosphate acyltransferase [Vibrio alginolyticus]ELA6778378.1 1-acyl-sn-glycerol-3-phosphate acyltransferase [Vibrio alginolyticus]MBS9926924.1 1-acyl-sn-glycerol-3-phosphate acyltransferase [Vibrio alginolyticus]
MTANTDPYIEIRPYNDEEIPAALDRLIQDDEFITAILEHRFANKAAWFKTLMSPILRIYLKAKWSKLDSVEAIQIEVKKYLKDTLNKTTDGVTFSGLDKLDKNTSYLFVSNHRDIAMDPALVNYGLYQSGHRTVRIAIGDNLLKKPCATELMRLNKSFIVKRSAKAPREMMKALGQLSSYIKHSLDTGNSIWIAQKEGRAKDGNDFTDPAILKMFHVEGRKQKISFGEYTRSLKIVPVSIAYENDPCDISKAKELYEKAENGRYEKGEFEDIESIIQGIVGYKGRVHVAFGDVIEQEFETPESLAGEIDRQIHNNYKLYPINLLAAGHEDSSIITEAVKRHLADKLDQLPEGARPYLVASYANPVNNQE